jgi:hypothetical protein
MPTRRNQPWRRLARRLRAHKVLQTSILALETQLQLVSELAPKKKHQKGKVEVVPKLTPEATAKKTSLETALASRQAEMSGLNKHIAAIETMPRKTRKFRGASRTA